MSETTDGLDEHPDLCICDVGKRPDPECRDHATEGVELAVPRERQVRDLVALASWLISMDNPSNPEGMAARRTVTLTQIIERAKAALPSADELERKQ